MEKKLCPLMVVKYEKSYQKFECDREQCAWWIDTGDESAFFKGCALKVLATSLKALYLDRQHPGR